MSELSESTLDNVLSTVETLKVVSPSFSPLLIRACREG